MASARALAITEILQDILEELVWREPTGFIRSGSGDIFNALTVNRHWSLIAQEILWKCIENEVPLVSLLGIEPTSQPTQYLEFVATYKVRSFTHKCI